ncbi:MAG: NADH-quinone oxidoreductase subunit N [Prevotellaceae bacterium]|jgi:NADH-quinone oxidoreductase subunit N|nr:NADH-quinone oxidoreductase subunit N [Prevotellaceae bacterium]
MDFSNFLKMQQEISLMVLFLILIIYDIFGNVHSRKWLHLTTCILFGIHTVIGFFVSSEGVAFGGMYVTSAMTVMMKNILNIATCFVLMQSGQWLNSEPTIKQREGEFYTLTTITLLGMYLMISASNFMMLYISIETAALPLACLTAYNKYKECSAEAGAKFILISALSSGIMMFGLSYLYGATGTLYFSDLSALISNNPMILLGFVFFFAGLAFKISLVPFHLWTADVYEGAPTGITAYLSVVSKGAACFVLMFTLYHVFGNIETVWYQMLWGLSVITIIIGNLFAIRQKDIKRFFAFSSISQAGYIMLGIMGGTEQGITATVYYVFVYMFSNLAAFGVITSVENQSGRTDIAAYNGLYKSNPKLAFVMMIAVFSLAGIPPFAGFMSKFFIFAAAAAKGDYLLVFIALANTVVSLYYYLMIVRAMFINQMDEQQAVGKICTDSYNKISLTLCTVAIVLVGLVSGIYGYIKDLS